MDKLVNYYLLCNVDGKIPHVANSMSTDQLSAILSKREQRDYLRRVDGNLIAAETIIGGNENVVSAADGPANTAQRIMVFY